MDNNKDIQRLAVKSKNITITTASIISIIRKLSMALIKITLPKGGQDIKVTKI